jgi:hypothetical protein
VATVPKTAGRSRPRCDTSGWEVAVLVLAPALLSLAAFLLTAVRCGAINLAAPIVKRSLYCRALNAPALPNRVGSAVVTVVIFVLPAVVAGGGAIAARRTKDASAFRYIATGGAVGIGLSFLLIAFAHADYATPD